MRFLLTERNQEPDGGGVWTDELSPRLAVGRLLGDPVRVQAFQGVERGRTGWIASGTHRQQPPGREVVHDRLRHDRPGMVLPAEEQSTPRICAPPAQRMAGDIDGSQ